MCPLDDLWILYLQDLYDFSKISVIHYRKNTLSEESILQQGKPLMFSFL